MISAGTVALAAGVPVTLTPPSMLEVGLEVINQSYYVLDVASNGLLGQVAPLAYRSFVLPRPGATVTVTPEVGVWSGPGTAQAFWLDATDQADPGVLVNTSLLAGVVVAPPNNVPAYLADSGTTGTETLTATGTVANVVSPSGFAFFQAVQFGALGSALTGPPGTGPGQGAMTGGQFTADVTYTPSAADVAGAVNLLGRWATANEWIIYLSGGALIGAVSIGGVYHPVGSAAAVAGTTYRLSLTWDGVTYKLWVNGAVVAGSYASGAFPAIVSQPLTIGGNGGAPSGQVDEVRISNTLRAPGGYAAAPFVLDVNSEALYHFDLGTNGSAAYTLPAPARLQSLYTQLLTPFPGVRSPVVQIEDPNANIYAAVALTPAGVGTGVSTLGAYVGAPPAAVQIGPVVAGITAYAAGLPSLLLPAGWSIGLNVENFQPGDVLQSINLGFTAN